MSLVDPSVIANPRTSIALVDPQPDEPQVASIDVQANDNDEKRKKKVTNRATKSKSSRSKSLGKDQLLRSKIRKIVG